MVVRRTRAETPEQAADYQAKFADFARYELRANGPDQHMWEAGLLAREAPDPAWFIGCYMGPYHVPAGIVLTHAFPTRFDYLHTSNTLWLQNNIFGKIAVRKERRPVMSAVKMNRYLHSFALWLTLPTFISNAPYTYLWDSLDRNVYGVGRYSMMRLLEGLREAGVIDARLPDVRFGRGGDWSPRLCLSYMFPQYDAELNGGNRTGQFATEVAMGTHAQTFPFVPSLYRFETLLCNFRQWLNGKYYIGRALDSELERIAEAEQNVPQLFGVADRETMYAARRKLFPAEMLGEVSGWSGRRHEASGTFDTVPVPWR